MTSIDTVSVDEFETFVDENREVAPKRILFNVGHPAQVHLFRNAIAELQAMGHETLVASRHKEVTTDLLDAYGIAHVPLTTQADSFPGLVWEMLVNEKRLLELARSFRPDVIVSRLAPPPVHVSKLFGCKNVIVSDTLPQSKVMRRVMHGVTLPFVDYICLPASLKLDVPNAQTSELSFQELAYLHPDRFTPDSTVLRKHGIDPEKPYFVLRLGAWEAYHDAGHSGMSIAGIREIVDSLASHGDVYVSAEGAIPPNLDVTPLPTPPEDILHVLAYATLYVGDSTTMSVEAALLGTPAVRSNSLVVADDYTMFGTLEADYGLMHSFEDEREAIETVKALVRDPPDRETLQRSRQRLVEDYGDVTSAMVEVILEAAGGASPDRSGTRTASADGPVQTAQIDADADGSDGVTEYSGRVPQVTASDERLDGPEPRRSEGDDA